MGPNPIASRCGVCGEAFKHWPTPFPNLWVHLKGSHPEALNDQEIKLTAGEAATRLQRLLIDARVRIVDQERWNLRLSALFKGRPEGNAIVSEALARCFGLRRTAHSL